MKKIINVLKALSILIIFIFCAIFITFIIDQTFNVEHPFLAMIGITLGVCAGFASSEIAIDKDWI